MPGKRTKASVTGVFERSYLYKIQRAYIRTKEAVCEEARAKDDPDPMMGGACLRWATHGANELEKEGIDVIFQAGSMHWRTIPADRLSEFPDDYPDEFGYAFGSPNPLSIIALKRGWLPEMHIWLADTKTQAIIDFSTGALRHHFMDTSSLPVKRWLSPEPPVFLVAKVGQEGGSLVGGHICSYECHPLGMMLAIHYARGLSKLRPKALHVSQDMLPHMDKLQGALVDMIENKIHAERMRAWKPLKDTGRLLHSLGSARY